VAAPEVLEMAVGLLAGAWRAYGRRSA